MEVTLEQIFVQIAASLLGMLVGVAVLLIYWRIKDKRQQRKLWKD